MSEVNIDNLYKSVLDELYDGVYFIDINGVITYWNMAAEKISGYSAEEVLGKNCSDNILTYVDSEGKNICKDKFSISNRVELVTDDLYLYHKEGHSIPVNLKRSPIVDDRGKLIGAMEIFSSNTENQEIVNTLQTIKENALFDPSMEVGNRKYTEIFISAQLSELKRYDQPFGVIFCNIDDLKTINKRFSTKAGDMALKIVSTAFKQSIRPYDFIGRWGEDEFVIILKSINPGSFLLKSRRLIKAVEDLSPDYGGESFELSVSAGATMARKDDDCHSLVERCEDLMRKSKAGGKNRVTTDKR